MPLGAHQSAPQLASSVPSRKNNESGGSGTKGSRVRSAGHLPSASSPPFKPLDQGKRSTPIVTTVTGARSSVHQKGTRSNDAGNVPRVATEDLPKKEAPKTLGASYAATVACGPTKHNQDPIKAVQPVETFVGVQGRLAKRTARTGKRAIVDKEIVSYLQLEFAGERRDADTPRKMFGKARKFIKTFDLTHLTGTEVYEIVVRAVAAAVRVPVAEQEMRQFLKDSDTIKEMGKHNKLVSDGDAGRIGALFKKSFRLPSKQK